MNLSLRNEHTFYVCATILARDMKELEEAVFDALRKGADLVELRLDYLENMEHVDKARIPWNRSIITLRSQLHGGLFEGDSEDVIRVVKMLLRLRPRFVDLEMDVALKHLNFLPKVRDFSKIIVSWHSVEKTPEFDELKGITSRCVELGDLGKIVTMARSINDSIRILMLYRLKNFRYINRLVAFAMGEQGLFSRVMSLVLGNPLFYVAYKERAAPGQIRLEEGLKLAEVIRGEVKW